MNRNAESHFAQLPRANIERSRFDRSHSRKFTGNIGQLLPFCVEPVLPGDTWEIDTSKVLRLQTLVSPVMGNAFLDVYWFFVPLRLVWDHAKEFFGENTQSAWYPQTTYTIPKITIPQSGVDPCSLMDYLGLPPYLLGQGITMPYTQDVNALRLRGYLQICDQWFRDQNVENPLNIYTGDATVVYNSNTVENGGKPFVAAKMHDIFTSCLPGPQKAARPVEIPASGILPVSTSATSLVIGAPTEPLLWQALNGTGTRYTAGVRTVTDSSGNSRDFFEVNNSSTGAHYAPINLIATSTPGLLGNGYLSMSVTDLRLAFQTQKFLERQARGGSRYREILLSHFGVVSPDARQQVPEYLGGNRVPIQVSQVVNSAESANQPLGNLGAYSHTVDVHSDVFKSFSEHGYLYGLAVVRYEHDYSQYADQDWFINDIYDLYWPEFAAISEQPIPSKSLYFQDGASVASPLYDNVFGYQEAWARYRYAVNELAGEMRPYVANGLQSWSFADVYSQRPTLSASWIKEDKDNIDRVLAVTSSVSNQYWADFYIKCTVTRPMPLYSIPGLVDHF